VPQFRASEYVVLAAALGVIVVITQDPALAGFDEIHTLLEGCAAIIALIVSAMAFSRYYSQPNGKY
jgi:uncharacterized membrane protein